MNDRKLNLYIKIFLRIKKNFLEENTVTTVDNMDRKNELTCDVCVIFFYLFSTVSLLFFYFLLNFRISIEIG